VPNVDTLLARCAHRMAAIIEGWMLIGSYRPIRCRLALRQVSVRRVVSHHQIFVLCICSAVFFMIQSYYA